MEVFEEKSRINRQSSSASYRIKRNSKVGYILTMAGIVLLTLCLLVIIHFTREYTKLSQEISDPNLESAEMFERRTCDVPFCNTKECVYIAATILESMNTKANPCTDFYEYACGGYRRAKAVPYASDHYSPAKEAQEELLIDLRKTLEKISSDADATAVKKMKKLYNTCLNATLRDEEENRTLSFWFRDLKLVPPNYVLGNAIDFEPLVQWPELVTSLEQYQIHTLFKPHFVATTHAAPEKLEVDCLLPFLKPEAYLNTTEDELIFQLVLYKEAMNAALEQLHMDREAGQQFVQDVIKIETDIARTVSHSGQQPSPYLTEEYKQQLREIWRPVVGNAVQDMEIVTVCKYDMQDILTILNEAPNKSVIKYIMWRMLMQTMQYMGTEFRNLHLHYMTKLPNVDYAYESKWRECVDVIRNELGPVATKSLFEHGYIQTEAIGALNAEFDEIKRDIALISRNLMHGIDESLAKKFSDKLKGMKLETGYSELFNQEGFLDTLYANVDVGDHYFTNILELKRFKTRRKFLRLWYQGNGDIASQVSLEHTPLGSSSTYDYLTNTVHIDLGLLRPPVYRHSNQIPQYLKYGYSSLLAREMSKASDITGSCYDAEGQRFEKVWWPSSIEQKYDDFLKCLGKQIMELHYDDNIAEINDTRILNNIMADMGAFFIPYEGLKSYLRNHMNEKPLPGVPLNKKQTFYVQAAQLFCELRSKPASDPTSKYLLSPKSRVNVAVSNMEDFGSTFNCPAESEMNLKNKCNLFNFLPDEN